MNLREELLKEHSKAQCQHIAQWIGCNKDRFAGLMRLFLHDEYRVVQRSARVVSLVAVQCPGLLQPYLAAMVHRMSEPGTPVAVKRNVVRILQFTEVPEAMHGIVMHTCFDLLADPKETVAVRCFSMTVLANLSKIYPELKPELRLIIADALAWKATAGFRARARQVLKQID